LAEDAPATALSPKGEAVRDRILSVALEAFARAGFKNATTRAIVEAAGVSLPALRYYFGSKEDLYRACAEAVVSRYRTQMDGIGVQAVEMLAASPSPEAARVQLKALMRALATFLTGAPEAPTWGRFIVRQMSEAGEGLEILHTRLWAPGVKLVADLISVVGGYDETAARIRAIWLISNAMTFQAGRQVTLQLVGWRRIGAVELDALLKELDAQINEIGRTGTAR
jgi:TetR/AcrR family transcriptional regulator, regulator of cefoperazone and chloramphenicol sensitivity